MRSGLWIVDVAAAETACFRPVRLNHLAVYE